MVIVSVLALSPISISPSDASNKPYGFPESSFTILSFISIFLPKTLIPPSAEIKECSILAPFLAILLENIVLAESDEPIVTDFSVLRALLIVFPDIFVSSLSPPAIVIDCFGATINDCKNSLLLISKFSAGVISIPAPSADVPSSITIAPNLDFVNLKFLQ